MVFTKKVIIDPIREIFFGSIGASFTPIGTALTTPCKILFISNGTNESVYISDDGQNSKLKLPANSFSTVDLSTNRSGTDNDDFLLEKGTILYIKHAGIAPTSGSVWVEIFRREKSG